MSDVDNPSPYLKIIPKFLGSLCHSSFFILLGEHKPIWFGLAFICLFVCSFYIFSLTFTKTSLIDDAVCYSVFSNNLCDGINLIRI